MPEVRCPKCGSLMILRSAKRGPNAGGKFYGCSRYPKCKATVPFKPVDTEPGGKWKVGNFKRGTLPNRKIF